jgi:hypothetical protein
MSVKPTEGSAIAADAFREAHARLLADRSIQFELRPIDPPPETPDWLAGLFRFLGSPAMEGVFWIVLGLAALTVVYLVALRLSGIDPPWRRRKMVEAQDDLQPAQGRARQLLQEADELAERGMFSEAAHLLLFRSIEDIDTRRPELVRPAYTSRDIAALADIPEQPRGAFARIAMMVERSLFAMRPLGPGDWAECRTEYERFAFADAWRR